MQLLKPAPVVVPLLIETNKYLRKGQYENAKKAIDKYINANPYDVHAWTQRALLLILTGQEELALDASNIALKIDNTHPDAWSMHGNALMQLRRFSQALASYEETVRLAPNVAITHYNKANALRSLGQLPDAISAVERSLYIDPKQASAITLMGALQKEIGNLDTALKYFNDAISIDASAADAHYNRALLYLSTEQFQLGWQDFEWRLRWNVSVRQGQSRSVERFAPDWDGEATVKPVLIVPEQGIGDQIFFAGMLTDLQRTVAGSTVCVEPRLLALLARSFTNLNFTTPAQLNELRSAYQGSFAAQIHMGSLGQFFRNVPADFHRIKQGYLTPHSGLTNQFKAKFRQSGKVTCGISWRSKNSEFGPAKSLTLSALAPLLRTVDANFIDLQYGDTATEISDLTDHHGISICQTVEIDKFHNIDAMASLVSACDIVITVSNTTAHLAAALGKPVLVMLSNSPSLFWYWHRNRNDSPWYPSAVLLRQTSPGDWNDVVDTATHALTAFIKATKT